MQKGRATESPLPASFPLLAFTRAFFTCILVQTRKRGTNLVSPHVTPPPLEARFFISMKVRKKKTATHRWIRLVLAPPLSPSKNMYLHPKLYIYTHIIQMIRHTSLCSKEESTPQLKSCVSLVHKPGNRLQ